MLRVVDSEWTSVADVVKGLRALADVLEADEGVTHNVAYVVDRGAGVVDVGLLGQAPHPATTCYFLMGVGMQKLVQGALSE